MDPDIRALTDEVESRAAFVETLLAETGRVVVGQRYLVERVVIGLLTGGHVLLEGVPGLAKTLAVRTASVFASPGTPSKSTCPSVNRPIKRPSTRCRWPMSTPSTAR